MIVVEKALTLLAMPCGLLWLGLIVASLWAWRIQRKGLASCLLALLIVHTAAGNDPLGKILIGWLEQEYAHLQPLEEGPFNAVFLLGGGTGTGTNGLAQLTNGGDRVALATRLYHAGCAERVVVTGQGIASLNPHGRNPAEEAAEILRGLAVPEASVFLLSGRNTREEIKAIAEWTRDNPDCTRLAVVTSAFHMPRVMRLVRSAGVDLAPLPADFRGGQPTWNVLSIIPCADGFENSYVALKEMLAKLAGK